MPLDPATSAASWPTSAIACSAPSSPTEPPSVVRHSRDRIEHHNPSPACAGGPRRPRPAHRGHRPGQHRREAGQGADGGPPGTPRRVGAVPGPANDLPRGRGLAGGQGGRGLPGPGSSLGGGHPCPHQSGRSWPSAPSACPRAPGARAVWCALAVEMEEFRDRHPGRGLHEDVSRWHDPGLHADQQHLHQVLARAGDLLAAGDQLSLDVDPLRELSPEGWSVQLEQAHELAPRLPEPALEQSLGMDLGW